MAAWQSAHRHYTVLPAHLPGSSHFVNKQPFSIFKINGKKSKLLLSYKEQILPSAPGARLHSPARQNRQGLPAQLWVRALVLSGALVRRQEALRGSGRIVGQEGRRARADSSTPCGPSVRGGCG